MRTHEWTPERLGNTLAELRRYSGDTHRLEVKKAHDGYPKSLDDTLCSFSNIHGGGTIICGVAEKESFKPVGVYDIAQLEKLLRVSSANNSFPEHLRILPGRIWGS